MVSGRNEQQEMVARWWKVAFVSARGDHSCIGVYDVAAKSVYASCAELPSLSAAIQTWMVGRRQNDWRPFVDSPTAPSSRRRTVRHFIRNGPRAIRGRFGGRGRDAGSQRDLHSGKSFRTIFPYMGR